MNETMMQDPATQRPAFDLSAYPSLAALDAPAAAEQTFDVEVNAADGEVGEDLLALAALNIAVLSMMASQNKQAQAQGREALGYVQAGFLNDNLDPAHVAFIHEQDNLRRLRDEEGVTSLADRKKSKKGKNLTTTSVVYGDSSDLVAA
jgi:hypothetical protein